MQWIPDKSLLLLIDFLLDNANSSASSKVSAKHGSLHALASIVVGLQTELCPRSKIVECVMEELTKEKSPPIVLIAACDALGKIGGSGRLTKDESVTSVNALIQLTKLKSEETNKLVEHAIVAIGDICETQSQPRATAIDGMFKLQLVKYEEIQFAAGETLSRIGLADSSSSNKRKREEKEHASAQKYSGR